MSDKSTLSGYSACWYYFFEEYIYTAIYLHPFFTTMLRALITDITVL